MAGMNLRDRPLWQQVLIGLGTVVQIGLLAYSLWDIRSRPAEKIRGPKRLWLPLLFVNYVGPISYLALGRRREG